MGECGPRVLGVGGWGRKERADEEGALRPSRVRFMRDCSSDILPYAAEPGRWARG